MFQRLRSWNIERKARLFNRAVSKWMTTPEGKQYIKLEYPQGFDIRTLDK